MLVSTKILTWKKNMICKAMNYKIISYRLLRRKMTELAVTVGQLFIAIFLSTLLISCDGEGSSNIEDADIDSGGGGEVIIDGETVSPDDDDE